jgi:pSer/pThr/pTyr-binding forkhead associated (FHA) protein
MSVGRANANTLRIRDERVSAHHVRIEREESRFILEVTADDAPTTLNGSELRMGERHPLNDGDVIGLAGLEFRYVEDPGTGALSRLWVVAGVHRGKTFRISTPEVLLGRATDNDVQFPDRSVSRHHCRIRAFRGQWWIDDLGSTNGTILCGVPVRGAAELQHGDEVMAGFSRFVFQEADRPLAHLSLEPTPPCN